MSSKGFDYVTEDVTEFAREELDEAFGEGQWQLEAGEYARLETPKDFPAQMIIIVIGKSDSAGQEIGLLTIENDFFVDHDGTEKWIAVKPRSIEQIKVKAISNTHPQVAGMTSADYEAIEKALTNAIGAEVTELTSYGLLPKEIDKNDHTVSRFIRQMLHSIAEGQDF